MLDSDDVAGALHGLLTGAAHDAIAIVRNAEKLDAGQREALAEALRDAAANPSTAASAFGFALLSTGHGKELANEAFKAAFYLSDRWQEYLDNPLFVHFIADQAGPATDTWVHYFPIFVRYLQGYRDTEARVVLFGSDPALARRWQWYFGLRAHVHLLDPDLAQPARFDGPPDVVIDTGRRAVASQIAALQLWFPQLADGGLYLVEDCHRVHAPSPDGGLSGPDTVIDWVKGRVEDLHGLHHPDGEQSIWTAALDAIHVHDSIVVLDKRTRFVPFAQVSGGGDVVNRSRTAGAALKAAVASRNALAAELVELRRQQASVGDVSDDLRYARADVVELRESSLRMAEDLRQSEAKVEVYAEAADSANEQMRWMRRSFSWRITAPLRAVRRRL